MSKELESYLDNKNVQAFLGLIRDTEGTAKGADPYRVYGGSAKTKSKTFPNQTSNAGDLHKLTVRKTLRQQVVRTSS